MRCLTKNIVPIVVGGSGFYIQALVDGLYAPENSDSSIKEKWSKKLEDEGREAVFALLTKIDPVTAERLHPNDTQRIVRALEVYEITGKPISVYNKGQEQAADFEPVFVGLNRERAKLYERINQRVDLMMDLGLLEEIKSLQTKGYGPELNALRTVGYKEGFDFLSGQISMDRMTELIKQNSRRYAKRQKTWFRKEKRIKCV